MSRRTLLTSVAGDTPAAHVAAALPVRGGRVSAETKQADYTLDELIPVAHRISEAVNTVVVGKPDAVRLALTVLLAEGHALIEDVPGVGKTLLAKALARSIDCSVRRVQFTPDLLPSDIT